jgi:hypothetical protein
MAKKKVKRKSRAIVVGHLERVSSKVFDDYKSQITELIQGHHGVYSLYRRSKLYYIGLATDFKKRLNQHLKDRHKGKWTHFSLYLIRKVDYIRELEALLLRIADPTGNYIRGKLKGSKNLRPGLKKLLAADFKKQLEEILGDKSKQKKTKKKARKVSDDGARPLAGLLRHGQGIYAEYKGKKYHAVVYSSGNIRFNGKTYVSPSGAGLAVRKKSTNGWAFWKYKDKRGNLRWLSEVRQSKVLLST